MTSSFLDDIENLRKEIIDIRKEQNTMNDELYKLRNIDVQNLIYKKDCQQSRTKIDASMCGLTDRVNKISERISQIEGKLAGQGDIVGRILNVVEAQQLLLSNQSNGILANKKTTLAILLGLSTVGGTIAIKLIEYFFKV